MARMGLLKFRIGGPNVLTDWVYVDNLVHAHLLASMALIDDLPGSSKGPPPAAGQAYFISDGTYVLASVLADIRLYLKQRYVGVYR